MVWVAFRGKQRWLQPRQHLTWAFKREALEDIMVELKEMKLLGADFVLGLRDTNSILVRIDKGKRWARIHVRRERNELWWMMDYAYHKGRVNRIERRSLDLLWPRVKDWLEHGQLHVFNK